MNTLANAVIKPETMKKRKSHAFGKDCYLIGCDKYGDKIWLEAASWNCEWYWGFGYIKVYTTQSSPSQAMDINSHSHWSGLLGKQDSGEYLHHINESLQESVLTETESWELSDMMKTFYTLKEAADTLARGGSHLSGKGTRECVKSVDMAATINNEILPALFQEIYKILAPESV